MEDQQGFQIRWFTPKGEINLCGHATLASSQVLLEKGYVEEDKEIVFNTKSGKLTAKKVNEYIELDFPANDYKTIPVSDEIKKMFGCQIMTASETREDILVELISEKEVRNYIPDLNAITNLDK